MVEAPGTAPGSEWFIATAIYRHSRQAGTANIGVKGPRRKSRRAVLQTSAGPGARTCGSATLLVLRVYDQNCGLAIDHVQALTVGACRIPPPPRLPRPNLTPPRPSPLSRLRGPPSPSCVSPSRASRYLASAVCWRGRAGCWLKTKVG